MKKRIIKRVGHEFDIYEDGRRYGVGPGYMVQLDENGRVIDLIDFVSPLSLKGLGLPSRDWNLGPGTWDVVQSIQITFPSPTSLLAL